MACYTAGRAQTGVTVSSFNETTDFIPLADQRRDLNGNLCAMIKVQVLDDISDVEGAVMGDVVTKGVEKRVYMAPKSRNLIVHFKNNLPIRIRFADYGVTELSANRVYELILNVPNSQQGQAPIAEQSYQERQPEHESYEQTEQPVVRRRQADDDDRPYDVRRRVAQRSAPAPKSKKKSGTTVGLRAGYNMANASFSSDYESPKAVSGFQVGLSLDVPFGTGVSFGTGLIYSARGYKYEGTKVEEKANPSYIDIPLMLMLHLPMGESAEFQIGAGPYVGLCVGGKVTDEANDRYDESFSSAYSSLDYGAQVAAGLLISHTVYIGAGYQVGLTSSYQNRNLFVSIGLNF